MHAQEAQGLLYQVRLPREARRPSAMVLVSGNFTISPAALDRAASLAPHGSAAKIRIEGLMDLAANATPDIKPPPTVYLMMIQVWKRNKQIKRCRTKMKN